MKINLINPFLLGMTQPVWGPADEGNSGGGEAGEGGDVGAGDEGQNGQTDGVVLGDDGDDAAGGDDGAGDKAKDSNDAGEGGDDDQTDEEKEAAAKAAEVPEDGVYEFDVPEGVEFTDEAKTYWSGKFKDMGLTRGQAQTLVAAQSEQVAAEQKAYADFIDNQQKEHKAAAEADKDIGGDKWDETVKLANAGLRALRGGPKAGKNPDGSTREGKPEGALESLILTSGNGNNPEILRELRRIGQAYANDKFEDGNSTPEKGALEKNWYGATTPDTKKR